MTDIKLRHLDMISLKQQLENISTSEYSTAAELARRHKMLDDLLCTIHRDGGHKIAEVGYLKATEEAIAIVSKAVQNGDIK